MEEKAKIEGNEELQVSLKDCSKSSCVLPYKASFPINNLSLAVAKDERVALLGNSGTGKTLIYKMILGTTASNEGSIRVNGVDPMVEIPPSIGYCPQRHCLVQELTVGQLLRFALNTRFCSEEVVSAVMRSFQLYRYEDAIIANLSIGIKKKVNFAISMLDKPELLLLDEPTNSMDQISRRLVWQSLSQVDRKYDKYGESLREVPYTLILSTTIVEEAEMICDRVVWLNAGNIVCNQNAQDIKQKYSEGYILRIKFHSAFLSTEKTAEVQGIENFEDSEDQKTCCLAFASLFAEEIERIAFKSFFDRQFELLINFKEKAKVAFLVKLLYLTDEEESFIEHFSIDLEDLPSIVERHLI